MCANARTSFLFYMVQMRFLFVFGFLFLFKLSSGQDIRIVKYVVDGDTFWVSGKNGAKDEKIRLIGMDAHETRKTYKKEVGFYGKQATAYLKKIALYKNVRLEYDVGKKDRYGRTLAYAYLDNGTFINADLVRYGYAVVLTIPPNVKYAEKFILYQQQARKAKRGLWGIKITH